MEGIYPIIIDGENVGTLTVGKTGAGTEFDARCRDLGRVIRLSVYGGGAEGYLGVPVPEGGELRLRKKLSRAAMAGFPGEIESVGIAGGIPKVEPMIAHEPEPEAEVEPEADGPFWYAASDGALFSADSGREMVALPPEDERVPKDIPGECRVIEGKEYLVYISKELGGY